MVVENSKEESLVEFACKCREDECLLVNNEPICPGLIFMKVASGNLNMIGQGKLSKRDHPSASGITVFIYRL